MKISKTGVIAAVVAGVVVIGLSLWLGPWWTLGIVLGIAALLALVLLLVAKTDVGRRTAEKVGRRVGRTRIGQRMTRAQLRNAAKRKGVSLTDPFGRPLSDVELQLEVIDTPETRAIKRQLRNANPQQRAQLLRMLQAQTDEVQRTGKVPEAMPQQQRPPGMSGRPVTRPPRARRKKKR
jgi:hypothetical protein